MAETKQQVELETGRDRSAEADHGEAKDRDSGRSQRSVDSPGRQRQDTGRDPQRDADEHGTDPGQPQRQRPARAANLLITVFVALIGGVIGAMGYLYVFGAGSGAFSATDSDTAKRLKQDVSSQPQPSSTEPAKESSTEAPTSMAGINAAQEVGELKEQVRNLNRRIDQLNTDVERLHQVLSLTLPLLQRIAPKS